MWESRSRMTSCPRSVWASTQTRLPWVPEVTNSPASLPSRSAAVASSRSTVGSSPHTSSPTGARAIASRISGVGMVRVSDRRSLTSCTASLPLRAQPLRGAAPIVRVGEIGREPLQKRGRFACLTLAGVDLGQQPERFRNDQRARVVLENQLQPLPSATRIALGEVVVRHPELLLGQPTPADVDLGQRVCRVAALRVVFEQLLELFESLGGDGLILLHRLDLVVVTHGQPILDQIGDLMSRVERQEHLELLDGFV